MSTAVDPSQAAALQRIEAAALLLSPDKRIVVLALDHQRRWAGSWVARL